MSVRRKLSHPQQYVLQVILNRGVIDHTDFKTIYSKTLKKFEIDDSDLSQKEVYSQFIREINDAMRYFSCEIQKGVCEITGNSFYCFVRTFDSGIGKLSALYQPTELKIFQIILDMIMESDDGIVNYNDIINQINDEYEEISTQAQTQAKTITKIPSNREMRTIIEQFANHYWLMEIVNAPNNYTLHGRAIIELDQYLKDVYGKETCFRCKKLLIVGMKCSSCGKQIHRACAKEFFNNQYYECTHCKQKFTETEISSLKETISGAKAAYNAKYRH